MPGLILSCSKRANCESSQQAALWKTSPPWHAQQKQVTPGLRLLIRRWLTKAGQLITVAAITTTVHGCNTPTGDHRIALKVFQDWQLQPGDQISGYTVTGGLGDISINVRGQTIYAPFNGTAKRDKRGCLFYSSAEVPAYLFRLCGIQGGGWIGQTFGQFTELRLGAMKAGDVLGHAQTLQFATLRKQNNGKWAIVEPDKSFIESLLKPPPQ